MYLSKRTLELTTFVLLSFSHVARAAPHIDSPALEARDGTPTNDLEPRSTDRPIPETPPVCNTDATYSLHDSYSIYTQLREVMGEENKNCWTDPTGGCNTLQQSGGTQLQMCGPPGQPQQFASCQALSVALYDLNKVCGTNDRVGGSVAIPYLDSVTLQLHAA